MVNDSYSKSATVKSNNETRRLLINLLTFDLYTEDAVPFPGGFLRGSARFFGVAESRFEGKYRKIL